MTKPKTRYVLTKKQLGDIAFKVLTHKRDEIPLEQFEAMIAAAWNYLDLRE